MNAQNLESKSDALNYIIESSQTPQAPTIPVAPLRSTPPFDVEQYHSNKLPANIERELQHFLNGRDSPLIALMLSDIPRKNPSLTIAVTALHDAT